MSLSAAPRDFSLGEVQALAFKATRGAGRSVGMAEEAGFAARWLAGRGFDAAGILAELLDVTDGQPHDELAPDMKMLEGRALCPIALGTVLSDHAFLPEGPFGPVHCPMYLLPFLNVPRPMTLTGGTATITLLPGGGVAGSALPGRAQVLLLSAEDDAPAMAMTKRAVIAPDDQTRLEAFAHRTYAPATDESRARGAGGADGD